MEEEKNEDFDQKRFIIAMVLSGAILIGWQYFFPAAPPTPSDTAEKVVKDETKETLKSSDDKKEKIEPTKAVEKTVNPVILKKNSASIHKLVANSVTIETSSMDASVLTANIVSPTQYQKAKNLLEGLDELSKIKPFSIHFENENIDVPTGVNWEFIAEDSVKKGDAYTTVAYRFDTQKVRVTKVFTATDKPYVIDIDVKIENRSDEKIQDRVSLNLVGFNDPDKETSFLDMRPDEMETLCKSNEDIERALPSALEKESTSLKGPILWGGVDRRYIAILAIPKEAAADCTMSVEDKTLLVSKITNAKWQIGPKTDASFSYTAFVGPKDFDALEATGSKLEEAVDYGILTVICRPLRWALVQCHKLTQNWGWAIILLTVLIRLALWPVNKKVYTNSEGMKEIQPELAALKEKYKNDQKRLSEETMKLFRENGVSMLGCAPMLIQMPILLAFYWTILYSAELFHADWALWYVDLSAADPYYILPVLMGGTMFLQQQMMPTPSAPDGANAAMMKTMMKIMPITMTAFMLFLPAGVNLYYFLSLLIGVIQQYLIKKSFAKKAEVKTT